MKKRIKYISVTEVLQFHYYQINAHGGSFGVRDEGALISALYRPQLGYYKDILEEAAALWESLSQNHPFIDGNKRTAFITTMVFLEVNGYTITATEDEIIVFIDNLYQTHNFEFKCLVEFLQKHIQKYDSK